jgi:hypothetical protein
MRKGRKGRRTVVGLVRTLRLEAEVVGLGLGHLCVEKKGGERSQQKERKKRMIVRRTNGGKLDVERLKVSAGNLLVELLGEDVDTKGVLLNVGPEGDLGEDLVGERAGHDPRRVTGSATEVNETTLSEEDDVAARLHGVAVDLGLDVADRGRVGLEPRDVDLDVEVTDAVRREGKENRSVLLQKWRREKARCTHLQTMASSGMASKCSPRMMSRQPVVVTKMLPWGAASSMVVTSKPAIAAWRALMGSISVMITREPYERRDSAH